MIRIKIFLIHAFFAVSFLSWADSSAEKQVLVKQNFSVDLYLGNNIGAGTTFKQFKQEPYIYTELYAYPNITLGTFLGDRKIKLQAEIGSAFDWVSNKKLFTEEPIKKFNLSDIKFTMTLLNALKDDQLGLSLTPAVTIAAPVSSSSRSANRILAVGGSVSARWSNSGFFVTYKPSASSYIHSAPYKESKCQEDSNDSDRLSNGKCKSSSKQTMFYLKNSIYAGYGTGDHKFTLGFRFYHHFLRGEGHKVIDTKGSSNIMEATLGVVEYAYNLPFVTPMTFMVGLSGYQGKYDASKRIRVPFFDFVEPEKNQTEFYLALEMSI